MIQGPPHLILLPMLALMLHTMLIASYLLWTRVTGVRNGTMRMKYFRVLQGEAPDLARQAERNYANLFEMPVLFYALVIVIFVTGMVDPIHSLCAWAYVAARLVHSAIHLSYNNVMHRLSVFLLSASILTVMLMRLALQLFAILEGPVV